MANVFWTMAAIFITLLVAADFVSQLWSVLTTGRVSLFLLAIDIGVFLMLAPHLLTLKRVGWAEFTREAPTATRPSESASERGVHT